METVRGGGREGEGEGREKENPTINHKNLKTTISPRPSRFNELYELERSFCLIVAVIIELPK